jgi:hypothetical protein
MANEDLQLDRAYVLAGQSIAATGGPYTVSGNGKITIDVTNDAAVKADLGSLVKTSPASVVYPVPFSKVFQAVDLSVGTKQTLFTVPAGLTAVITKIVLRGATASLATASFGFGFDANASDVVASATHTELTGATLETTLSPIAGAKNGAAAAVFGTKATITQSSAAVTIDVHGYYV